MTALRLYGANAPVQSQLEETIRTYGAIHVLIAVVRTTVRNAVFRREKPPDVSNLNARLRRDIGLNPKPDVPEYWDHFR
ncbi:MAG: hypothetical protein ABJD13_10930 [Paracoccaceae bacterium]